MGRRNLARFSVLIWLFRTCYPKPISESRVYLSNLCTRHIPEVNARAVTMIGQINPVVLSFLTSWRIVGNPSEGSVQGAGSIAILSFTADEVRCAQPR